MKSLIILTSIVLLAGLLSSCSGGPITDTTFKSPPVTTTIAVNPSPITSADYNSQGINQGLNGQWVAAIADFSSAIELDSKNGVAYYNRGTIYSKNAQWDLAISDYSKSIAIDPTHAGAIYGRGFAYAQEGQKDLAIADLNKYISLSPDPQLTQLAKQKLAELQQ